MNAALTEQYNNLEKQRAALMAFVHQEEWEKLNQAPPGQWSVCQVLAHLITAEKLSVQYMAKKIQGIHAAANTSWREEIRMLIFKASQRLPLRYRAPVLLVEQTPAYASLAALVSDWDRVRSELKNLLEKIRDEHIGRQLLKHPVAGRVNIRHAMVFFSEHILHHHRQLNRLLLPVR